MWIPPIYYDNNSSLLFDLGYPDGLNNFTYVNNKVVAKIDYLGTLAFDYTDVMIDYRGPGYWTSYFQYTLLLEPPPYVAPGRRLTVNGKSYKVLSASPYSSVNTSPPPPADAINSTSVFITKVFRAVYYTLEE